MSQLHYRPQKPKKPRKSNMNKALEAFAKVSQLGFTLAASVFIGVMVGRFVDYIFNTSPWFVLIFSILGLFAAIKILFDLSS